MLPTKESLLRHREVITFACGIMVDPSQIVDHVFSTSIQTKTRTSFEGHSVSWLERVLFESMYTESRDTLPGTPLHNPNINDFVYRDILMGETSHSHSTIYVPSKLYLFDNIGAHNINGIEEAVAAKYEETPECSVFINYYVGKHTATETLLKACRKIVDHQPLSEMSVTALGFMSITSVEQSHDFVTFLRYLNDIVSLTRLVLATENLWPYEAGPLVDELKNFKKIRNLKLSVPGLDGQSFVKVLQSWGSDIGIKQLSLRNCELPNEVGSSLLCSLPHGLTFLHLSGNVLTGSLNKLPTLPSLSFLALSRTCLNRNDILSLSRFMEERRFPELGSLWLVGNNLHLITDVLKELIQSCVNTHTTDLEVKLYKNKLPTEFQNHCAVMCKSRGMVTVML